MHTTIEAKLYRIVLFTFLGLLIFGQFGRITIASNVAIYLHELILTFLMAWAILFHPKQSVTIIKKQPFIGPFLLIVASILISLFGAWWSHDNGWMIGSAYAIRFVLYAGVFLVLSVGKELKYIKSRDIRYGLYFLGLGLGILGLAQYIFFPDTRFLKLLGWDDHYYRLISTLFDPPFTAALLIVSLLLLQYDLWIKPTLLKHRRFWIGSWTTLFVSLLLTYSRASYVAYAGGIIMLFLFTRRYIVLIPILLLMVGIVILPRPASEGARLERTVSIQARVEATTQSLQTFSLRTLVIGNGWYVSNAHRQSSQLNLPSHSSSVDNSILHIIQSTGMLGLGAFIWFGYVIVKKAKNHSEILIVYIALLIASQFNNVLFYPWVMVVGWSLVTLEE